MPKHFIPIYGSKHSTNIISFIEVTQETLAAKVSNEYAARIIKGYFSNEIKRLHYTKGNHIRITIKKNNDN